MDCVEPLYILAMTRLITLVLLLPLSKLFPLSIEYYIYKMYIYTPPKDELTCCLLFPRYIICPVIVYF